MVVCFLGCGGGGPAPATTPPPVDNERDTDGVTRVYAWDGQELVGLYCATPNGLETAACGWPARLALPLDPPVRLELDVHPRVLLDDSRVTVHAYGDRPVAELVIISDAGVSLWSPSTVLDGAGVELLPHPKLVGAVREKNPAPEPLDAAPTFHVPAYHARVLAVLDLDRDGVGEVIYYGDDDGGDFVTAVELDAEGGFDARSGG